MISKSVLHVDLQFACSSLLEYTDMDFPWFSILCELQFILV